MGPSSFSDPSKALDSMAASSRGVGAGGAGVRERVLKGLEAGDGDGDGQDDALAAFNPYGGAFYKGFRIGGVGAAAAAAAAATAAEPVKQEKQELPSVHAGVGAEASILPISVPAQLASAALPHLPTAPAAAAPPAAVFKARANTGKGRVRGQDD